MNEKIKKQVETSLKKGPKWLKERTLLLGLTGSRAYGTNTEESDYDFRGICIPPESYFLGLESFNEYRRSGGKNFLSQRDELDLVIMHLNKFVSDAMQGVPNNIELLFLKPEDYLILSPMGKELVKNRHLFLSKNIFPKFGGFALSQIKKLKYHSKESSKRKEIVEKYGYDTKYFLHAVRLLTSAIEILETGDFSTRRPNADFLLDCRNGRYSFEEAVAIVEELDKDLKRAFDNSKLQDKPDYNKVNELLININKSALNLKSEN